MDATAWVVGTFARSVSMLWPAFPDLVWDMKRPPSISPAAVCRLTVVRNALSQASRVQRLLDPVGGHDWRQPTMKTIAVTAITFGALLAGTGVAHADNDSDYINNLKSHGLSPTPGISETQWEAGAIKAAHDICGMAASGQSRDGIKAHYAAKNPDNANNVNVTIDAAVATYCPQYW
jgi:hypothetical protein